MKIGELTRGHLSAVFAILLMVTANANAASIFIDAANLDGPGGTPNLVAFNFGQFEGGFSINGSTPITTGGAVFSAFTQLNFTGQWIDLGAATSFARTVFWVDPKMPTVIDEILQWTITPSGASGLATISGFFQGENGGALPINVNPADVIFKQKDASHDPFNFSAAFLGGQVITGAVPEPFTVALMSLGLAGIGYRRHKQIKKAQKSQYV